MAVKKRNLASSDRYRALAKSLYGVKVEGRPIVELFLEIPDANLYPDYTKVVDHPISLAEIGKRIKNGTYKNDSELIQDFEKMANNAKDYNGDESPVYDDAVDILDFVLLWFGQELSSESRSRLQLAALNELESFKSKGRKLSDAFMVEPDAKTYPNYRDVVKQPSSFSLVRKQLANDGPADSWAAFKEQVGLMFHNAMLYNQEGSTIYLDAKTLLKQLDNKIAKYSQIPRHLETALPSSKNDADQSRNDEDGDGEMDSSGDMEDDDDEEEEEEEEDDDEEEVRRPSRSGDVQRFEDDDDDDFEADFEDMDEEDLAEEGDEDGQDNQVENIQDPNGLVDNSQFLQPTAVYDEIVYRAPDEGPESALLRLVTFHSTPIPSHMAMNFPIEDVKRAENDVVQVRIPPSPTKVFTTYATTLPYYQSTLRLTVFPNTDLNPLQVVVLLNGAPLAPLPRHLDLSGRENYDVFLAPGLNQITIIAIKASYGGYIRQYGPPPLAESEPDEERVVLFLNLSK